MNEQNILQSQPFKLLGGGIKAVERLAQLVLHLPLKRLVFNRMLLPVVGLEVEQQRPLIELPPFGEGLAPVLEIDDVGRELVDRIR